MKLLKLAHWYKEFAADATIDSTNLIYDAFTH
jgi:hypothetical protein